MKGLFRLDHEVRPNPYDCLSLAVPAPACAHGYHTEYLAELAETVCGDRCVAAVGKNPDAPDGLNVDL